MADDTNDKISSGILGLGGAPVPKEPGDPTTEYDEHPRRVGARGCVVSWKPNRRKIQTGSAQAQPASTWARAGRGHM